MQIKSIMTSIAVPFLKNYGFSLTLSDSEYYVFENTTYKASIEFDCPSGIPPTLLKEYFESCKQTGSSELLPRISTLYSIKYPERRGYQILTSYQLQSHGDFFYNGKDDFKAKLIVVLEEYVSTIFPYMVDLVNRYIFSTSNMYILLAKDTQEQAHQFAQKYTLSMDTKSVNMVPLESVLVKLRTCDSLNYRQAFDKSLSDIISAAAYLGELLKSYGGNGTWEWFTAPDIITPSEIFKGETYYRLVINDIPINPLEAIICFWNYFPDLMCDRFDSLFQKINGVAYKQ